MCKRLITPLFLLLTATVAQASWMPVLTLDNQDLVGAPGDRVGWGFSLYNNSPYDLYVMRVYADGTLYGTKGISAIGTFRDDIDSNYPGAGITLATGITYTGSFPADGLASFSINAGAPVGGSVNGKIYLDFDLYDSEMVYMGPGKLTAQYNSQNALASVTVTVDAAVVPVPSTYALLCIGLGAVGYARKKTLSRRAKRGVDRDTCLLKL